MAETSMLVAVGMEVCDSLGEKIGTVARVHHPGRKLTNGYVTEWQREYPSEETIEVRTGLLGFGKHLYVPSSGVKVVERGRVMLSESRAVLEAAHWHQWRQKPPHIGTGEKP